jgi:lysyl-tRNA synthetase class 2
MTTGITRQTLIKKNLRLRADIFSVIRRFFNQAGYLEVETPHRIPAPAPEVHIDAEPSGNWFLHTSPELCMKQMLAAGFSRIYQICKCFRQKERGRKHLPEMTMLEWYEAGSDYMDMMKMCEDLICFIAGTICQDDFIFYQGRRIALTKPWDRITVRRAFEKYAGNSMEDALQRQNFDEIMACKIEPRLGTEKPVFLHDYPAVFGSLAQKKTDDPLIAERFELYIGSIELCNAFTELTNPLEQRQRFEHEIQERRAMGKKEYPMPEKFLSTLQHMPRAAGIALGLDRLTMLFADTTRIDDVVAFTPDDL